jgi:hypothetical protein
MEPGGPNYQLLCPATLLLAIPMALARLAVLIVSLPFIFFIVFFILFILLT